MQKLGMSLAMAIAMAVLLTLVGLRANIAIVWAQPARSTTRPAPRATGTLAERPTVTQPQACGYLTQPLSISLPANSRRDPKHIVTVLGEDLSPTQTPNALASGLPSNVTRLATRDVTSTINADTVASIVAAVYIGGDEVVRAALVERLTQMVVSLGPDRVSINESRARCYVNEDPATHQPVMAIPTVPVLPTRSATGTTCPANMHLGVQSRSRYLRGPFAGDFVAGSVVSGGRDFTSWANSMGRHVDVTFRTRANPFNIAFARVYDASSHPRPGARLCKRLPELVEKARTAHASNVKDEVLVEQSTLINAAISEGDLLVAMWATSFSSTNVSRTLAGVASTAECEQREVLLQGTIAKKDGIISDLNGKMGQRLQTIKNWMLASVMVALLALALLVALVGTIKYYRDEIKRIGEAFKAELSAAMLKAVNEFWGSLRLNEISLVVMERTVKGSSEHVRASSLNTDTVSATDANTEIVWLAATLRSMFANVAPAAEAPKTIEPTPTPNAPAEPMLASDHLFGVTALACAMFFVLGQVHGSRIAAAAQIEIKAQTRAGRRLATRLKKTRGLKEAATVAAREAQGARTEIVQLLIGAKILDSGIAEVPHDLALPSIGHQIGTVGRTIASHDAEVRELTAARDASIKRAGTAERELYAIKQHNRGTAKAVAEAEDRVVKAEGDIVLHRAFPETIWPEVFGYDLPDGHIPTGQEISEVLRRLRARRVETTPHPAAPTTSVGLDLSDEAPASQVSMVEAPIDTALGGDRVRVAWYENNNALTRQFEVPRHIRRASNPLLHQTVMVSAAAAPEAMVHSALTVALPAANGGPLADDEAVTVALPAAVAVRRKAPTSRTEAARPRAPAPSTYFAWLLTEAKPVNESLTPADVTPPRMRRAAPSQPVPVATSGSAVRATTPVYTGQAPQVFVASMITPFAMLRPPTPSGVVLRTDIGDGTETPDALAHKAG